MSNLYYVAGIPFSDELYHHGIKGQRWGVRRFENYDGTLTPDGRIRYRKRMVTRNDHNADAYQVKTDLDGKRYRFNDDKDIDWHLEQLAKKLLKDHGFDEVTDEDVKAMMSKHIGWWDKTLHQKLYDLYGV